MNCDDEEQTHPTLSDQEIVDIVRNVPLADDKDDDDASVSSVETVEKKSFSTALQYHKYILDCFLQTDNVTDDDLNALNHIEKRMINLRDKNLTNQTLLNFFTK